MSGNVGEGIQYELIFDLTTYTAGTKRNHALKYTGVDITCEPHDASAMASTYTYAVGMAFAGVAFIDFPYVEMSAALAHPYEGTNLSIPYPGGDSSPGTSGMQSTSDMVTVLHRCRATIVTSETVTAGTPVILSETADGAVYTHDGMIQGSDNSSQIEIDCSFGIAETGATVTTADTHDDTWNQNDGEFTAEHPAVWVSLWR